MLNWMHVLWMAAICTAVLLGCLHLFVWTRRRSQPEPALIAALSFLVAVCACCELRGFLSQTPAEYAAALRGGHAAAQFIVVIVVVYVQLLVPGRKWLALLTAGIRLPLLAANFGTGVSLSFLAIDGMRSVSTFAGASFMIPVGTANPWFLLAQFGNLLLGVYLVDRLLALGRTPPSRERRRARQLVAALLLIVVIGVSSGVGAVLLGAPIPQTLSLAILGFAVIVSIHLADDLLRASELAQHLRISTSTLDEVRSNLRLVEESAGLGLWHWDADAGEVQLSARAAHIVGRSAAENCGSAALLATVDPADRQRVGSVIADLVGSDADELGGQFRVLTESGARRWVAVHGRIVRDQQSRPAHAHGIVIDVTNHHGSDVIFDLVFDASPIAMLLVDEVGCIARCNQASALLTGYPADGLIGMAIEALVPPEFQAEHADHRRRYAANAAQRAMQSQREVQLLTRDGSRRTVTVTLNPIVLEGRSMVIATVFDNTLLRQQERERTLQRAALAHVARVGMLAELSGSLAHEINQPLAAILSNAQASLRFIARESPDLAEVSEGLREVVDNAKRASEVIRRLRAMLRKDPPDFALVDVNEAVHAVVQLLHSDLIERGSVIEVDYAPTLPRVRGDDVQLQQVLLNLISNAAEAMAGMELPRRIRVSTRLNGANVQVSVADRGPGVPEAERERIFQPFVSSKSSGLGFGLALSKTLVEAHGGRIWVSDNPPPLPGACFHLLLPRAA